MAKKEADQGGRDFTISVDNKTAVENLKRFGNNGGFDTVVVEKSRDDFSVRFLKSSVAEDSAGVGGRKETGVVSGVKSSWAVFIGNEGIGNGDLELGTTLMKMFFFTLTQGSDVPSYVLFMNEGVKVPVGSQQAIEHLKVLAERGTKVLVCGTCLNFYGLSDSLKVGIVSNMYDIAEAMLNVDKVITL
jgi:selenium metabolism protein YedF